VHRSREDWNADRAATFAVLDATTAVLLASVRLAFEPAYEPEAPGGPVASVGYWTAPRARGTGVGRRSVAALCRWGFGFLALERISWTAVVGNHASRRLAESVGFTVVRPHHRHPRLRLELKNAVSWREDVEQALERLLASC